MVKAYLMTIIILISIGGFADNLFNYKNINAKDFILVESGEFIMGNSFEEDEGRNNEYPTSYVLIYNDFYMDKYEITNDDFILFLNDYDIDFKGRHNNFPIIGVKSAIDNIYLLNYVYTIREGKENYPAVEVSYYGAITYCNWLNETNGLPPSYNAYGYLIDEKGNKTSDVEKVKGFRLPTEAEWEFAAKGGIKSKDFIYSGSHVPEEVAWFLQKDGPKKVGTKKPNELEIYDMSGNALEWCSDSKYAYSKSDKINPYNFLVQNYFVCRGGAWMYSSNQCRVTSRYFIVPSIHMESTGFRICINAEK